MRRWSLVPMLLLCLLVLLSAVACSQSQGPQSTQGSTGTVQGASTTTTAQPTTTTLRPATWEAMTPTGDLPSARLGSTVVYVSAGNKLLLFGGWTGGSKYSDGTWAYDLTTNAWADLKPTGTPPPARASQAMAYDPVANKLIVFGGYDGKTYYGDTWAYDLAGNAWTELKPAGLAPAARQGHSLVYDPQSKKMILFGGYDGAKQYGDTWAYDPAKNSWKDLKPKGDQPAARDSQAMAYDPDDKVMILFGGWSTTTQFADTWVYDPDKNSWTDLKPTGDSPAARALPQMTYDPGVKRLVLFGGGTSSATFDDCWMFDYADRAWVPAAATGGPPSARAGHALVYNSAAHVILLFGGSDGLGTYFNDLWRLRR